MHTYIHTNIQTHTSRIGYSFEQLVSVYPYNTICGIVVGKNTRVTSRINRLGIHGISHHTIVETVADIYASKYEYLVFYA